MPMELENRLNIHLMDINQSFAIVCNPFLLPTAKNNHILFAKKKKKVYSWILKHKKKNTNK